MNLLIVGGLLGIALLAVLGVVLLSIGEQSDRRKAAAQIAQVQAAQATQAAAPVPPVPAATPEPRTASPTATIPLRPLEEMDGSVSGKLVSRELYSQPAATSRPLTHEFETTPAEIQTLPSGQLYELMDELQELRKQAAQIESRLGLLSEMLNHMQHAGYQEAVALGE
jgi:type II secretory pathway pseudopilin PulG